MIARKTRVLFVTGTESPFQVELARAINDDGRFDYAVAFDEGELGDRGEYWRSRKVEAYVHRYSECATREKRESWTEGVAAVLRPDVVIVGGFRGARFESSARLAKRVGATFGVFAERPSRRFVRGGRLVSHLMAPCPREVAFVLAVGDRAVRWYAKWLGRPQDVHWFPYYQRLEKRAGSREEVRETRFLFSGRLIPRNRVENIIGALERTIASDAGPVALCISGAGPSERLVRALVSRSEGLLKRIRYDNDFREWGDRLRPFRESDVLLLPAEYSGWGLVVPEALSMGLVVVTTPWVEAARHMVRHGENGFICDGSPEMLAQVMSFLVGNRAVLRRLQECAVHSADAFDVGVGAVRFVEIVSRYAGR